jgi:hypothetical protein
MRRPLLHAAVLLLGLAGCRTSGGGGTAAPGSDGSMIQIDGSELSRGTLLDAIRIRVPAMLVTDRSGQCPLVMFRGQRSMTTQDNPSVYVDGTLMSDTCALQQISVTDVRSVEVYPGGLASRPGIRRNPFGIIMVFRNRA